MEDELFDYGTFKLRKDALIHNIKNNIDSYIAYKRLDGEDAENLRAAVNYIIQGVDNGSITKDLEYIPKHKDDFWFKDSSGNLDNNNKWHNEALKFLNIIANSQGKLAGNKKATEEKEEKKKDYDDFITFIAQSIFPNAKDINDPNLDWDNFAEVNKGKEAQVWTDLINEFITTRNVDPTQKESLGKVLKELQNGVDASDYVAMNKANIPSKLYKFISEKLSIQDSKEKETPENKNIDNLSTNQNNTEAQLLNKVSNALSAKNQGDYFIENKNGKRTQYVLWNNEFKEIPMSFINEENFERIRNILKQGYKNRYETENIENVLNLLQTYINDQGNKNDNAVFNIGIDNNSPALKLFRLLKNLGYSTIESEAFLNSLHKLIKPRSNYNQMDIPASFKQGGIIKAQDGIKVPAWFNNIWAHTQLYGWSPELRKDKWKQQVGFHGDADSLESVYNANANYTSDKEAVTGDIQNYYSSGTYANKQAFMDAYNNDIDSLNNFFVYKREYGSDAGNHANIFKNVYKSRSGSGNLNYDLGYQEDLSPIMGSTMWHRRADRYEKKFDELSDLEKKNRIHKIMLSDGAESYVYKKYNGQIADIADDEAKRILAITEEPLKETSERGTGSGAGPGNGDKESPIIKEDPVVVPKESSELSKNLPFTLAGFLDATNVNKEIRDKQGEMTTPLQDPIRLNRNVYGNLRAIAEANKRGAQRNALVRSMFTSDNSQNMAMLYDTFNKNMEDFQQALAIDDATMRETSERSLAEKKEEYLKNHEIFWGNEQRLSQLHNEGVLSDMAYLTAQHQSRKNLLDELKTYTLADVRRNEQYKRAAAQNKLWQHIQRTPGSYIVGWNAEDEKLWNRYQSGENITNPVEKQRLQQINQLIQEAYQQGLYPNSTIWTRPNMNSIRLGVYSPTGVVASVKRGAKLAPYMRKRGGAITKNMTDAIIKYLKESNKNYNKSIDRSVRGLYNSIKLQRNKK